MRLIILIITITFLLSGTMFASESFEESIPAYWNAQFLQAPSYNGQNCIPLNDAVHSVLPAVNARNLVFNCYYYNAEISFQSLKLYPNDNISEEVQGVWKPLQFTFWRYGYQCNMLADALRWLIGHLEVRNVYYAVYCYPNSQGSIQYRFDALVPAQ